MISRQQFIDAHKHELCGLLMDAVIHQRAGSELALWVRMQMQRLDARLGLIYDSLVPKPDPVGPVTSPNGSVKAKV